MRSVELEVSVTIGVRTNVSGLKLPPPVTVTRRLPMVPIPWGFAFKALWLVTQIPGLPAKSWVLSIETPHGKIAVNLSVVSSVGYGLIVDGEVVASDSYVVKEGEKRFEKRIELYAAVKNILEDPNLINETLGLAPRGWVVSSNESVDILILALDYESKLSVCLEYRVGNGSWKRVSTVDSPLMKSFYSLVNSVNSVLESVERWVEKLGGNISIPRARLGITIAEATIPPQSPGTYVMIRAIARTSDGRTAVSPAGLYYVVNWGRDTRILIIDPHVFPWLLAENYRRMFEQIVLFKPVALISRIVYGYRLETFHHWELLGKHYDLYIAWPDRSVVELLREFRPNVIILSNLWLGVESYGRRWWDWDLRDIRVGGKSLLQHIVDYVGKSHAGIIATHATLSDEILWLSCEEKLKVGTRGHVGYDSRDIDVVNEKTVAALLGMPELTLFEHLKDRIAETLCWSSEYGAKLVGSTPLHVPYVPWNGTLEPTPQAKELGWDLPQRIVVEVPSFAKRFGYRAYTEVGWQLALPKTLA